MKKLFENKLNFIPLSGILAAIIGIALCAFNIGVVGLILCGISLILGIISKVLCKKHNLDDVLCLISLLVGILAIIIGSILFGVYLVLDLVNNKDIG